MSFVNAIIVAKALKKEREKQEAAHDNFKQFWTDVQKKAKQANKQQQSD